MQRLCLTLTASLTCLLANVPAALAHDDDAPPPERVAWGAIAFIAVTALVVILSLRAARPVPKKRLRPQKRREMPLWLQRILCFDPWPKIRLPRKASRQVRRAYLRRVKNTCQRR